jgi:formate transporter
VLAGVYIGFGAWLMLACGGACPGLAESNPGLKSLVSGMFGLPSGLFMVLIAGAELFTGNTALVTAAVLEGKAKLADLVKNWAVSWVGNLVGSVTLAWLVFQAGLLPPSHAAAKLAVAKTSLTFVPVRSLGPLPRPIGASALATAAE